MMQNEVEAEEYQGHVAVGAEDLVEDAVEDAEDAEEIEAGAVDGVDSAVAEVATGVDGAVDVDLAADAAEAQAGVQEGAVGVSEDHSSNDFMHKISYSAADFLLVLPQL